MRDGTIVVGAGVFGASVARALAEAGERVLLVDREGPGTGTSRLGAGIVSHLAWHPLNVRLIAESARAFEALTREAQGPGDFAFTRTGSATLVAADKVERLRELAALQRAAGARVDLVAPDRLAALPGLSRIRTDDVAAAACCPDDGWGAPPLYAQAAAARAEGAGATVRRGRIDGLRIEAGAVRGILLDGAPLAASRVVVTGGIWSAGLLAACGLPIPVRAYRTQAARWRLQGDAAAEPPAILHDAILGFYLRPDAAPGTLLAGNGTTTRPEDPLAFKREADDAFLALTRKRLRWRFPALTGLEVLGAWAGLDSGTPDRHPLAGPDPRAAGLHLLVGGNGFGFMRAPALGAAVAARVLGEKPAIDLTPFAPARFQGREAEPFTLAEGFTL